MASLHNPVRSCGSGSVYTSQNGTNLSFQNLGTTGARVLFGINNNIVQFRRITQGNNVTITENANDVNIAVDDLAYDSTEPLTIPVDSLNGTVLGKTSLIDTMNALLYPIVPPGTDLTINQTSIIGPGLNLGDGSVLYYDLGYTGPATINWHVYKHTETIIGIRIDYFGGSTSITPTGNSQFGTLDIPLNPNGNSTITLTVTTATKTVTQSIYTSAGHRMFYGPTTKDGTISTITDTDIIGLANTVINGYYKVPMFKETEPASNYYCIAIPRSINNLSIGPPNIPIFKINGMVNNDFTHVRSNSNFTNAYGYTEPIDVWVSNAYITGLVEIEIS